MLRQVWSHGLDIDTYQRAEPQLWLVHKRFGWAYLRACVRSRQDWLRTKQYQRVHESIFINNMEHIINKTYDAIKQNESELNKYWFWDTTNQEEKKIYIVLQTLYCLYFWN